MVKEYQFWMMGASTLKPGEAYRNSVRLAGGEVLNRYWDESDKPREESYKKDVDAAKINKEAPGDFYRNIRAAAESGWDFSTRWMDTTGKLETIQIHFYHTRGFELFALPFGAFDREIVPIAGKTSGVFKVPG